MKNQIPESIIEDIRNRADIVEVVGEHVVIKKNGQSYKGLCPFHAEKTPSFMVNPAKRIYHCFGCHAGGNVFKFLMETESISFVDAVKKLAYRYHVSIPEASVKVSRSAEDIERETLLNLNRQVAQYFTALLQDEVKGKAGRAYIRSRAFSDATVTKHQLGWAAPEWRDLLGYFENKGIASRSLLEKAGLVKSKEKSLDEKEVCYDRFRGRVIFPLKDVHGNIIAFAGRLIAESANEPKYLNSPETTLYKKGQQLFGLHTAKEAIRREDQVLIVEGYFDQIRADEAGIRNTVATCGTALTPKQVSLLKNHTRHVVLVFDADLAGQSATERGFDLFLDQGMSVRVIALPEGHDPDSYIRSRGRDAFLELVETASLFVEYSIRKAVSAGNTRTVAGRLEIVNHILPLLSKTKNTVERTEGIKLLSEELKIEDRAILTELKKAIEKNKPFAQEVESKVIKAINSEEYYLLHILLSGDSAAQIIRDQVPPEMFGNEVVRQIAKLLYSAIDQGQPLRIDRLLDQTDNPEIRTLLTKTGSSPMTFENLEQAATECIRKIKARSLETKISDLKKERNEAERAGQVERSRQLHKQVREMQASLGLGEMRVANTRFNLLT